MKDGTMRNSSMTLVAALVALAAAAPVTADADPNPTAQLTVEAQGAGLTPEGGGYLGWSLHRKGQPRAATHDSSVASLAHPTVEGLDVASYQGDVDWGAHWRAGRRFAYAKATQATTYLNPKFGQQYYGSANQGFIRGAYHFAVPNKSPGKAQADFFVDHGGGWNRDGKTLPGMVDVEYNPYAGGSCYGFNAGEMVAWIRDFTTTYKSRTGRDAVIYTTRDWWASCTGNSNAFSSNPLWIASWGKEPTQMPASWYYYSFWQYADKPVDLDRFNAGMDRLVVLANGG